MGCTRPEVLHILNIRVVIDVILSQQQVKMESVGRAAAP